MKLRDVVRVCVEDCTTRIIRRVGVHARRESRKGRNTFFAFLSAFRHEHKDVCDSIATPTAALLSYAVAEKLLPDVAAIMPVCDLILYKLRNELLESVNASADCDLPFTIDTFLTIYELTEPRANASRILGEE